MDQQDKIPQEKPTEQDSVSASENTESDPLNIPKTQNTAENTEKTYVYRWTYEDQQAFDQNKIKKEKRKGARNFAIVMAVTFAVCIGMLVGVLLWNEFRQDPALQPYTPSESSIADVAEAVIPSTVLIETAGEESGSYGTGFFVREDGYIATNYHVVADADHIWVTLSTGQVMEASVVGYTQADDIAVLKVFGSNYPAVAIGNSEILRAGEFLVAVGHPGGPEAPWTTTHGIVSAVNRDVIVSTDTEIHDLRMIQTDAALNPGNSGGPICNLKGEVVGIVARKLPDTEGISLALPINGSMELINAIIRDGHAKNVVSSISRTRPMMGITGYDIRKGETYTYNNSVQTATNDGVLISAVSTNSGAYGVLKVSDILIGMDGTSFTTMEELKFLLYQYRSGDKASVTVVRNGEMHELSIVLGVIG